MKVLGLIFGMLHESHVKFSISTSVYNRDWIYMLVPLPYSKDSLHPSFNDHSLP
jgi:hypothetical protein